MKNNLPTYIENVVKDLVSGLLYYDRKEDEYLRLGEIEAMIANGDFSVDDIVQVFKLERENNS